MKRNGTGKPAKSDVPGRAPRKPKRSGPTDDEIRLRAYFIAERRYRLSIPGDEPSDWLEAKHQLVAETKRKPRVRSEAPALSA